MAGDDARLCHVMRPTSPKPALTPRFDEEARAIIHKDREDPGRGSAVDPDVSHALEAVSALGFAEGRDRSDPLVSEMSCALVSWASIPPRPRGAFWTICLFTLGRDDWPVIEGHLMPCTASRGAPGWSLILASPAAHHYRFGRRTIGALVQLGLLGLDRPKSEFLIVLPSGAATWRRFLALGGRDPGDGVEPVRP